MVIFALMLFSCDVIKMGVRSGAIKEGNRFAGVGSLNLTSDGSYVLYWDHAASSVEGVTYDIYMNSYTTAPADLTYETATIQNTDEGVVVPFQYTTMQDDVSPITQGKLLASVSGVRSYKLETKIDSKTTYAFMVRSTQTTGGKDSNQRVLVYSPGDNSLSFAGVSSLSVSPEGKLQLAWDAPTLAEGDDPTQISYQIYMDSTKASLDTIMAGSLNINLNLVTLPTNGQLVEMPEANLPSARLSPITEVKGSTYYVVDDKNIMQGTNYIFQVRARGPAGEIDGNRRAIVYQRSKLVFEGLLDKNVALATDNSKITLSWSAAENVTGSVVYVIYQDPGFSSVLTQTSDLSYTVVSPTPGKIYTLGVRAKDDSGLEQNSKMAIIPVPDMRDHTPPIFGGLVSATTMSNSRIQLQWAASPSSDLFQYKIYNASNTNQAIATTTETTYVATGLNVGSNYTFLVRAIDSSANEDTNTVQKSAMTLPYVVPDFNGVESITPLGGEDGLSKLRLRWTAAGGSVTGYQIFMSNSAGGEDYYAPISNVTDINTSNSLVGPYVNGQFTTSAVVTPKVAVKLGFTPSNWNEPSGITRRTLIRSGEFR